MLFANHLPVRMRCSADSGAAARRQSGFTLVELLAVMVVLGILMALALPIAGKVQENGRKTACSSNMRQIAISVGMTVDGRLKGIWPKYSGVQLLLLPYKYKEIEGKDLDIYTCPGTNDTTWPDETMKDQHGAGFADWDNIQTQCISYAGYDAKTYPVNKNKLGNLVMAADDNQFGPNHNNVTQIVYFDGTQDFVDLIDYEDQLPEEAEFVPVGPDSPNEHLAKLLVDF